MDEGWGGYIVLSFLLPTHMTYFFSAVWVTSLVQRQLNWCTNDPHCDCHILFGATSHMTTLTFLPQPFLLLATGAAENRSRGQRPESNRKTPF